MIYDGPIQIDALDSGKGNMIFYLDADYRLHIEGMFEITDLREIAHYPKEVFASDGSISYYQSHDGYVLVTAKYRFECVSSDPVQ